jgi:hypothetical protein
MAHMLLMPALQIGDPVKAFVLMKRNDFARGSSRLCLGVFHREAMPILRLLIDRCGQPKPNRIKSLSGLAGQDKRIDGRLRHSSLAERLTLRAQLR